MTDEVIADPLLWFEQVFEARSLTRSPTSPGRG